MEYLVTMTTHVPAGTLEEDIENIRAREALRARELADEGHLLRLWRPPLQPGEWRTLGLFAAHDDVALEKDLASMPLRVWRTDEVTPLAPHPNDPGPRRPAAGVPNAASPEFFTTFSVAIPTGAPNAAVEDNMAREAQRAQQLAEQGHLLRLWKLPGEGRSLGLWRASGALEIEQFLASLPLARV